MNIHIASHYLRSNTFIKRKSWADSHLMIENNEDDVRGTPKILIVFRVGVSNLNAREFNFTIEDLLADDWELA